MATVSVWFLWKCKLTNRIEPIIRSNDQHSNWKKKKRIAILNWKIPKLRPYLGWIAEEVKHWLASNNEGIFIVTHRVFLCFSSSYLLVISSLIEIRFFIEYKSLEGEKNLKNRGPPWIPYFSACPRPSIEETEADLSRLIQVRVNTESTRMVMHQLHKYYVQITP